MEEKKTCAQCAYFVMREEVPITEKNIMGEIILLKHMEKVMRTCPEIHRDSRKKERCYEPDVYPYATHGCYSFRDNQRTPVEKSKAEMP